MLSFAILSVFFTLFLRLSIAVVLLPELRDGKQLSLVEPHDSKLDDRSDQIQLTFIWFECRACPDAVWAGLACTERVVVLGLAELCVCVLRAGEDLSGFYHPALLSV